VFVMLFEVASFPLSVGVNGRGGLPTCRGTLVKCPTSIPDSIL
jgi:hypothetical protein